MPRNGERKKGDGPRSQNPALPDFWDQRFCNKTTPWDAAGVPQALKEFAAACENKPRVLIPGCGSAHEARYLCELGWKVVALDFSAAALDAARATLGPYAECLVHGNYFDFDFGAPFDLVYERAFLCALPRRMWADYATRTPQLMKPGAALIGFFYFSDEPKGPPFGASATELERLLSPRFERLDDREVTDSVPVFRGKERWQVWRRT